MIVEITCNSPDDLIFEGYNQIHDKSDVQKEGSISSWFASTATVSRKTLL